MADSEYTPALIGSLDSDYFRSITINPDIKNICDRKKAYVIFPSSRCSKKEVDETYRLLSVDNDSFIISLVNPFAISQNGKSFSDKPIVSDLLITGGGLPIESVMQDGLDSYKRRIIVSCEIAAEPFGELIQKDDFYKKVFNGKRNVNKGSNGKTICIGGSKAYSGAVYLTYLGETSYLLGSGYSYISVPKSLESLFLLKNPQLLIKPFDDRDGNYIFDPSFLDSILDFSSICIGNGMGVSNEAYKGISYLLKNYKGLLIIDADGLNSLAKFGTDVLSTHRCQVILTPHLMEFARLIDSSVEKVSDNLLLPEKFALKYNVIVLLKSSSSLITDGKKNYICEAGNEGLAKAGSGDILAGIILGLGRLENISAVQKAALGSYLLGRACEIYSLSDAPFTMSYKDLIGCLRSAINELV